jgi:hypothetical protein
MQFEGSCDAKCTFVFEQFLTILINPRQGCTRIRTKVVHKAEHQDTRVWRTAWAASQFCVNKRDSAYCEVYDIPRMRDNDQTYELYRQHLATVNRRRHCVSGLTYRRFTRTRCFRFQSQLSWVGESQFISMVIGFTWLGHTVVCEWRHKANFHSQHFRFHGYPTCLWFIHTYVHTYIHTYILVYLTTLYLEKCNLDSKMIGKAKIRRDWNESEIRLKETVFLYLSTGTESWRRKKVIGVVWSYKSIYL